MAVKVSEGELNDHRLQELLIEISYPAVGWPESMPSTRLLFLWAVRPRGMEAEGLILRAFFPQGLPDPTHGIGVLPYLFDRFQHKGQEDGEEPGRDHHYGNG